MIVIEQEDEIKKLKEFKTQLNDEYEKTRKELNELLAELKPLYDICDTHTSLQLIILFAMIMLIIITAGLIAGLILSIITQGLTEKQAIVMLACVASELIIFLLNYWLKNNSKTREQIDANNKIEELHTRTRALYAKLYELYMKTNKAVPYAYASNYKIDRLIEIIENDKAKTIHGAIYYFEHNY